MDSHSEPKLIQVHLKQSKTDPFRHGVDIFLGRTGKDLFPVVAILAYLAVRGNTVGPLFVFENGDPLSRHRLVTQLRQALSAAGIDQSKYCGHSFRIGAATAAAAAGMEDSTIQLLGRWQSQAFLGYIRTPPHHLAALSCRLAT